jgi:hypothetical protein
MPSDLRLHTDRLSRVSLTGAVSSHQAGELELRRPLSKVLTRGFLNRAAGEYWRLITRFTLGLVRVASDDGDQCVVLVARPLVLLRLHTPEYELEDGRGSVTWRIKRGILVAGDWRDRGFLRLSIARASSDDLDGDARVTVQMEVQNFYPWLRGRGSFARLGVWIYANTQQRIHRFVTRRFLLRLAAALEGRQAFPGQSTTTGSG